ncbi:MAG: hypothetical protein LAP87_26150 [Acidobacteriia bacterium]|nr:hypothetical protein [Terriglobia bacterium]
MARPIREPATGSATTETYGSGALVLEGATGAIAGRALGATAGTGTGDDGVSASGAGKGLGGGANGDGRFSTTAARSALPRYAEGCAGVRWGTAFRGVTATGAGVVATANGGASGLAAPPVTSNDSTAAPSSAKTFSRKATFSLSGQ